MVFKVIAIGFAIYFESVGLRPFTHFLVQKFGLGLLVKKYGFGARRISNFLGDLGAIVMAGIIVISTIYLIPYIAENYRRATGMINVSWLLTLINIVLCFIGMSNWIGNNKE